MVTKCPKCGQMLKAEPGQTGTCPKCKSRVSFPKETVEDNEYESKKNWATPDEMEKKERVFYDKLLTFIEAVSFLLSGVFFYLVFDKLTNYKNPEYYGEYVNAYVGGDAYNYIINGTYAITFAVLALTCIFVGCFCVLIQQLRKSKKI